MSKCYSPTVTPCYIAVIVIRAVAHIHQSLNLLISAFSRKQTEIDCTCSNLTKCDW